MSEQLRRLPTPTLEQMLRCATSAEEAKPILVELERRYQLAMLADVIMSQPPEKRSDEQGSTR